MIAENYDGELIYSDGFTWPCAQGLRTSPGGVRLHDGTRALHDPMVFIGT